MGIHAGTGQHLDMRAYEGLIERNVHPRREEQRSSSREKG